MTVATRDDRSVLDAVRRRLLSAPFDARALDRTQLGAQLEALVREEAPLCSAGTRARLLGQLLDEVAGLGPIERLLADPEVSEIMVNGPGRAFVERSGRLEPVPLDLDAAGILRVAERVIGPLGLRLDRSSPMVDARLADGSRLHAVIPPLAPDGPCITIRRFVARDVPIDAFDIGCAGPFVTAMVSGGWNVVVVGSTGAGKTTLCNAAARSIDGTERIVTIEETAELRLPQPHVVRLEARPANAEGAGAVSVRDLVRAALRMRPDRLIVGEVRGGEALDMLQALNTGHDGSLCTVHANGAAEALARLETLALLGGVPLPLAAVSGQLLTAVDALCCVARGVGGRRVVTEIAEVAPDAPGRVRSLFRRTAGSMRPEQPPRRPARRPAVDIESVWHRC